MNISFLWLLVVAGLGTALRVYPLADIRLDYKHILHAHSHVAFLGWIFSALFTLIGISFLNRDTIRAKTFNRQFLLNQVAVAGMLVSFLYQGYGAVSIFFSSLQMFVSVWFAISVFRIYKSTPGGKLPLPVKFLFAGLSFMVLSSLGPLSLPFFSKVYGAGSPMYSNAIYFYLHFQYNGWFIFTLLALLLKKLETDEIKYSVRAGQFFFWSLTTSCVLTYFLSVLWSHPVNIVWIIAGVGAVIQLTALVFFYFLFQNIKWPAQSLLKVICICVVSAFALKVILQFSSAFPFFAEMASSVRHFVIAYIHLVVFGVATLSIVAFYIVHGYFNSFSERTKTGILLLISGFAISELLAVGQGLANYYSSEIAYYNQFQTGAAAIMFSGIVYTYMSRNKPVQLNVQRLNINSIKIINHPKLKL